MDVHNAFLNGDLLEEVNMLIPERFARQGENKKVCKLHKLLYGLKQATRQWNRKLTDALIQMGFTHSHYDYSLFTKSIDKKTVIILVYVDDVLVTGSSQELINNARKNLQQKFKMKDLGELKFFLGIEVARSQERVVMCQRKYSLELVSEAGISGAKQAATLLEMN